MVVRVCMCMWVSVSDVCMCLPVKGTSRVWCLEDGSKMQDCVLPFVLFLCFMHVCNSCCSNCTSCCLLCKPERYMYVINLEIFVVPTKSGQAVKIQNGQHFSAITKLPIELYKHEK